MAVQVLTDVRAYVGGLDTTGQTNSLSLAVSAVNLDATTFGSGGWTALAGGLKSAKISHGGFKVAGAIPGLDQVDDRFYADLVAGLSVPATWVPTSGAAGSLAYLGKALDTDYKIFGKVGDLDPFDLSMSSDGPVARGLVLHPQGTARTTTGFGTGFQFPAVAAGQKVYMALHVLSITGTPTLQVIVQSDTSNAFSAPTTRATFAAFTTTTGGDFKVTSGAAITDTWWRVGYTIGGSSPSYLFAASAGIA